MRRTNTGLVHPGVSYQDEVAKLGTPPAGQETPEARALDIRRLAFAARIKQGAQLRDLADVFVELVHEEECLLTPCAP